MFAQILSPVWQSLNFEDLLLFVWVAALEPVLNGIVTRLLGGVQPWDIGSQENVWLALLFAAAGIGGLVVVGTRAPGEQDPMRDGGVSSFSHLPMIVTIGYMFLYASAASGVIQNDAFLGIPCLLFGLFIAAGMLHNRLPVLDVVYRRILIAPMILLGTWNFIAIVQAFFGGTDWHALLLTDVPRYLQGADQSQGLALGLVFAAVVVFYLVFILAPRQVAYPAGSWANWILRFGVFVVALVMNLGFARVL